MTAVHIVTGDSLIAGGDTISLTCCVCCRDDCSHTVGYVSMKCHVCGSHYSHDHSAGVVRLRRMRLCLTRRQLAEKIGITPKTVANYENIYPSYRYWAATKALMLQSQDSLAGVV